MKIEKMPLKNNDTTQAVLDWLAANYPIIYGAILAIFIAYARTVYDGVHGRRKWIEAVLCGALSLAASSGLDYFGLSPSLSPFIGGVIGFLGVEKVRQLSIFVLNKKAGNKE